MTENSAIRQARRRVKYYTQGVEGVIRNHQEAMDCLDCETHLQLGIEAYRWLIWADATVRKAVFTQQLEYNEQADQALECLFRAWLVPCAHAEKWVRQKHDQGYAVDNHDEFRQCCEEVRAIVATFDESDELSESMAELRDQALVDESNGQTTRFLEG